jgi:poly(3-hydroxybutyrate) depolymerase
MKAAGILIVLLLGTVSSLSATVTTTTILSSMNPSTYGQAVTFTATVTSKIGSPPDGETVTFMQGQNTLGTGTLSSGSATFATSTLVGGTDAIKAVYPGDPQFGTSTSKPVSQMVEPAPTTTALASSQNPSNSGQPVTFTASVASQTSGTPAGTVGFYNGTTKLGNGTLTAGVANFTTATLAGGTDSITAVYNGSASFASSTSSTLSQVVNQTSTTTTLTSSVNPSNSGESVTFTADVTAQSGTVTGTVTFYDGTTALKTGTLSGGTTKLITSTLPSGTDTITATYNGSGVFASSSASLMQTVGPKACGVGTFVDSTMTWDNITRYYEVYLPTNLPTNPPMVLMLHGTRTMPSFDPQAVISLNWGWQPVADQYCFILVKPASTYDSSTGQFNWNAYFLDAAFPYAQGCGVTDCPDDSGFLRALIGSLTTQYGVNPEQVYVAGFSSGAEMTERVGVDLSDLVAAIAPASGQLVAEPGIVSPPLGLPPIPPAYPISVQEWHGTLDENLWPCGYGTTKYNAVTFTLDTVDDTFNYWTPQNSCTTLQTTQPLCLNGEPNSSNDAPTPNMPGLTGNIATGCTDNVGVQFIWEPNVAHSWQQQYDTQRWQFFAAHPMSAVRREK